MKKVGSFFFTFLPFLLAFALQFLALFFVRGISMLIEQIRYTFFPSDSYVNVYADVLCLWNTTRMNTIIMILFSLFCISVFGIWYYARYSGIYLLSPKKIFHPLSIIAILFLVPGTQYLVTYLVSFIAMLFPQWMRAYEKLVETAGISDGLTVSMFCYSILLAPIGEELLFRGVTMHQAKKVLPFWAANFLQALLFGIFHMNIMQGIYAFFLGMILGYICEAGGSLYHSILLHILFNFWGTIISSLLPANDTIFSFAACFILGLILTIGGLILFRRGANQTCPR